MNGGVRKEGSERERKKCWKVEMGRKGKGRCLKSRNEGRKEGGQKEGLGQE